MKKKIVVGGSIGAVFLLVLAMFPAVVSAQAIFSNKNIKELKNIENKDIEVVKKLFSFIWYPGELIDNIILFLVSWFLWFSLNHPPSS